LLSPSILAPIVVALGLLAPSVAMADLQTTERGPVVFLESNHLDRGDEEIFARFLASPSGAAARIVYLDSRGGNTEAAIAIGRMIRQHGLDTAYHVGHGRCVSACTTIFLGGVHRYYVGGNRVADGVATHVGLGFHPSANGSQEGEGRIAAYYSDMGVPGAAQLRYRLYSRDSVGGGGGWTDGPGGPGGPDGPGGSQKFRLFFVSGGLALKAGVATSVGEPADSALRDEP